MKKSPLRIKMETEKRTKSRVEKNQFRSPFDVNRISLHTKLFLNCTFFTFSTFSCANRPIISHKKQYFTFGP